MNTILEEIRKKLFLRLGKDNAKIENVELPRGAEGFLVESAPYVSLFACLNGQPKEQAESYQEFLQRAFLRHENRWKAYDLLLVLLRMPNSNIDNNLAYALEVDPYFCRKYVLDPAVELESELARLPFFPLITSGNGNLGLPRSAHERLMQEGLSAEFATAIAKPSERGPDGIVRDCLEGNFSVGKKRRESSDAEPLVEVQSRSAVRLESIEISGFRAFRRPQSIDLSGDLTVLFGPNGLGKTSVFDAIDFACTGDVGRFSGRFHKKKARRIVALKHLEEDADSAFVRLRLSSQGGLFEINRTVVDSARANLDEKNSDRLGCLSKLCSLVQRDRKTRIDNLVNLFRASHLFNQSAEESAQEFRRDSTLPQDTVSRMLSVEDYVEAVNKIDRVLSVLEPEIGRLRLDLSKESGQLMQIQTDLGDWQPSDESVDKGKKVGSETFEIIRKLRVQSGSKDRRKGSTLELLKDARVELEGAIGLRSEALVELDGILNDFSGYLQSKSDERSFEVEINKLMGNLHEIARGVTEDNAKLRREEHEVSVALGRLKELQARGASLKWGVLAYVGFEAALKEDKELSTALPDLIARIGTQKTLDDELRSTIADLKMEMKFARSKLDRNRTTLDTIKELLSHLADLKKFREGLRDGQERLKSVEKEAENRRLKVEKLRDRVASADEAKKRVEEGIARLREGSAEHALLLAKVKRFVTGEKCPVCDAVHDSKAALLKNIETVLARSKRSEVVVSHRLSTKEAELADLRKSLADAERNELDCVQKRERVVEEIARVRAAASEIELSASELDLPAEAAVTYLNQQAKERELIVTSSVDQLEHSLDENEKRLRFQDAQLKESGEVLARLIVQRNALERRQRDIAEELSRVRTGAAERRIEIDKGLKSLRDEEVGIRGEIQRIDKTIPAKKKLIETLRESSNAGKLKENDAKAHLKTLSSRREAVNTAISRFERRLLSAGFNREARRTDLKKAKQEGENWLSDAKALVGKALKIEISLDALSRQAMVTKLNLEAEKSLQNIKKLESEIELREKWLVRFKKWRGVLETVRGNSLDEYLRQYGPLASLLQRRLRSVYGFGNLFLSTDGARVNVRVTREGSKGLIPSDFFSESQIQMVMLSLFLSANLTQSWSKFASVMMDDPIQHFDDLNCYALLDLIQGLRVGHIPPRQFVVSTCDRKFFRLAQEKATRMGGTANFYQFNSIGEDGPRFELVKRVGSDWL